MAGIYIHIPFCRQACTYCNFHFSTSLQRKEEMLEAIIKEISLQREFLQGEEVRTIYFGGGTPSLLSSGELMRIIEALYATFNISNLQECTLEANPDDITNNYLRSLRNTPVNRFSLGVQSFFGADLRYMNRAHDAQQSEYAIKAAQDGGFTNLSIDLIYGTPGLSDVSWKENIHKASSFGVQHLSCYALTVEEGTALHHAIEKNKTTPVDAAQSGAQFMILMEEAPVLGYGHYEISNLAMPGHYAVHNTSYWQGVPYLGIGPSAHSFRGDERSWNVSNNALYIQSVLGTSHIPCEKEVLTNIQRLNEYVMTSLRTMWGCDLGRVERDWDSTIAGSLKQDADKYLSDGRMIIKDNKLILTNKGRLFADAIAGDLFQ